MKMKLEKLFIIMDTLQHEIIAISEYKFHIYDFFIQNNFTSDRYSVIRISDEKRINDYLILLDDLYIEELYEYTVLRKDYKFLNHLIEEERHMVKSTVNNLYDIMNNCILDRDEMRAINTTIEILTKNVKRKNVDNFIDVKQIIYDFYHIDTYKYYREAFDAYNNRINN